MTDERDIITGKNQRNKYAREDIDAQERRDHELIREYLNDAPVRFGE